MEKMYRNLLLNGKLIKHFEGIFQNKFEYRHSILSKSMHHCLSIVSSGLSVGESVADWLQPAKSCASPSPIKCVIEIDRFLI